MTPDLGAILDLTWKLLLVLGLAVLAARLLGWLSNPAPALGGSLKVLTRVGLGSQQSVVLLGVGSKRLLLGVTPQQISVLAELAAADLPDEADAANPAPWASTFAQCLKSFEVPGTSARTTRPVERFPREIARRVASFARSSPVPQMTEKDL